jgi:hypothetical protein
LRLLIRSLRFLELGLDLREHSLIKPEHYRVPQHVHYETYVIAPGDVDSVLAQAFQLIQYRDTCATLSQADISSLSAPEPTLHAPVRDPGGPIDLTAPINHRTKVSGLINEYRTATIAEAQPSENMRVIAPQLRVEMTYLSLCRIEGTLRIG